MIAFANPIWLWALTGLAVPIAIHLLSRKEGKVIKFGSLRFFQESKTARFKTLRLNELMLLILRCLLLTAVIFLLAGVHFNSSTPSRERWVLLEKGLSHDASLSKLLDSLTDNNYQLRDLSEGFPFLTDSIDISPPKSYWSLIQQLKKKPLEHVYIIAHGFLENFKGERVMLPQHIEWLSIEPEPRSYSAQTVRFSEDSVWIRQAEANALSTQYESIRKATHTHDEKRSDVSLANADTITFLIVRNDEFDYDARIITASLRAIETITPHTLLIKTIDAKDKTPQSDWYIYLTSTIPTVLQQGNVMIYAPCHTNTTLLIKPDERYCGKSQANWLITKRLTESIALAENLTRNLASIILETHQQGVLERDQLIMPEAFVKLYDDGDVQVQSSTESKPTEPFWALLVLIILVSERALAHKRNQ